MPSVKGRKVVSWRTPQRLFLKAIAVALFDIGLRGPLFDFAFERVVPHWREYFREPPTLNAVLQRADKARRYQQEFEAVRPYYRAAWAAAVAGRPLGKRAVAHVLGRAIESAGKRRAAAGAPTSGRGSKGKVAVRRAFARATRATRVPTQASRRAK